MRKSVLFCLFAIIFCFSTACREKAVQEKKIENAEEVVSERLLKNPLDASDFSDICYMEDGDIRVAGTVNKTGKIWKTKDYGQSYDVILDLADYSILEEQTAESVQITLSAAGEAVVQLFGIGGKEGTQKSYYIDVNRDIKELEIQGLPELTNSIFTEEGVGYNTIQTYKFAKSAQLYGMDLNGEVHLLDKENGKVIRSFSNKQSTGISGIRDFSIIGKTLLIADQNGVVLFNTETGEKEKADKTLTKALRIEDRGYLSIAPIGEKKFVYFSDSGIYEYDMKKNTSELLIRKKNTSLGNENESFFKMSYKNKSEFSMLAFTIPGNLGKLYCYEGKNMADKYEDELTVFAMEDTAGLRKLISQYQQKNPKIGINLQVGTSEKSNGSASDAIQKLNTEILAGEGPDILILDGMPIDSYIQKGMLVDLNEIVNKAIAENEVFDKIAQIYQRDNVTYAVPMQFTIPVVAGVEKLMDKTESVTDIAAQLKQMQQKKNGGFLHGGTTSSNEVVNICYYLAVNSFIREDGAVNKEAVTQFYLDIVDIISTGTFEKDGDEGMGGAFRSVYQAGAKVVFNEIKDWGDVEALYTLRSDKKMTFRILGNEVKKTYIPKKIMGISSNSKKKELASDFINTAISHEIQKQSPVFLEGEGLPINKKALTLWLSRTQAMDAYTGGYAIGSKDLKHTWEVKPLSDEAREEVLQWVDALNSPVVEENVFMETALDEAHKCIRGEKKPKEAADKVIKQLELVIAENSAQEK